MHRVVPIVLVFSFGAVLFAQSSPTPAALSRIVGEATADRDVDSGLSTIELEAATDDTSATVKASRTRSVAMPVDRARVVFKSWSLAASAPLGEGGDATTLVSRTGFPDAFTLKGKYTRYIFKGRRLPDLTDSEVVKRRDDICEDVVEGAVREGVKEDEAKLLNCDSGTVAQYAPHRLHDHNALFFEKKRSQWMWGGTATVGHREFKYLQQDLSEHTTSKTPWGGSAFVALVPRNTAMLLTAGAEYRDKYKDADAKTLCPQSSGTSSLECKTGSVGAPVDADEQIVYLELRRMMLSRAVSFKALYDFEKDQFGLDVPIYMIRNSDAGLAGGIRVAWLETEGAEVGVFVTSSFSLFP